MTIIGAIFLYFSSTLNMIYIAMFSTGVFLIVRTSTSYVMMNELAGEDWRNTIHFMMFFFDGCAVILTALLANTFHTARSIILVYMMIALCALSFLPLLPESPSFLFQKKKFKDLHKAFNFMS